MNGLGLPAGATAPVVGLTVLSLLLLAVGIWRARWRYWLLGMIGAGAAILAAVLRSNGGG